MSNLNRKSYDYRSKTDPVNEIIKQQLQALSRQHPRYGFKKLYDLLCSSHGHWNHKRAYRIYCELGLNLKVKPKKRLALRTPVTLTHPQRINDTWSFDFMSDALTNGRRFRTANVIDDANREALGIFIAYSTPAIKVTQWLDMVAHWRGYPKKLRLDNGPENISHHMNKWAKRHHIQLEFIQPGKPAQNGYIERFNRSYREAVLDMYLFNNLNQVKQLTDEWIIHYNQVRPHESLERLSPYQYANKYFNKKLYFQAG